MSINDGSVSVCSLSDSDDVAQAPRGEPVVGILEADLRRIAMPSSRWRSRAAVAFWVVSWVAVWAGLALTVFGDDRGAGVGLMLPGMQGFGVGAVCTALAYHDEWFYGRVAWVVAVFSTVSFLATVSLSGFSWYSHPAAVLYPLGWAVFTIVKRSSQVTDAPPVYQPPQNPRKHVTYLGIGLVSIGYLSCWLAVALGMVEVDGSTVMLLALNGVCSGCVGCVCMLFARYPLRRLVNTTALVLSLFGLVAAIAYSVILQVIEDKPWHHPTLPWVVTLLVTTGMAKIFVLMIANSSGKTVPRKSFLSGLLFSSLMLYIGYLATYLSFYRMVADFMTAIPGAYLGLMGIYFFTGGLVALISVTTIEDLAHTTRLRNLMVITALAETVPLVYMVLSRYHVANLLRLLTLLALYNGISLGSMSLVHCLNGTGTEPIDSDDTALSRPVNAKPQLAIVVDIQTPLNTAEAAQTAESQ